MASADVLGVPAGSGSHRMHARLSLPAAVALLLLGHLRTEGPEVRNKGHPRVMEELGWLTLYSLKLVEINS